MSKSDRDGVIFLCTQMEAGGVQIRATGMAEKIRSRGGKAKTFFLYTKRQVFNESDDVVSFHSGRYKSPFRLIASLFQLVRVIKSERPVAVIGMAHYASPIVTSIGWMLGVPVRIATQTNPPISNGKIAGLFDSIASFCGFYTHNVATSKAIMKCFDHRSEKYKSYLRVIYNGIRPSFSELNKEDARTFLNLDQESTYLINCGRMSFQKNQEFILRLLNKTNLLKLIIVGEGELRSELEKIIFDLNISDRVILMGELQPDDVKIALRAADIFLFPSRYEAFGLAVVEAMAAGLPVISSNYPALCEVLGDNGVCLDLDENIWVDKIIEIISDDTYRESLVEYSLNRSHLFTLENMTTEFERLWQR